MTKTKFIFEETVKIQHTISVEGEDENMESALKEIERNESHCDFDSLSLYFEKHGCKVIEAEEEVYAESDSMEYYDEEDINDD